MSKLMNDDCVNAMRLMEAESVHSLITDPPAGISFMGKEWDHDKGGRVHWIQWMTEVMVEAMRVMKPGAHGLVWAIPRTSHWTATALENAGFEIRDVVTHIFGSGFPKSLDISKAIDKAAGAEREVVGLKQSPGGIHRGTMNDDGWIGSEQPITAPSTPEAKQWQGYGTALKPASEHWILIRKQIAEKTVAKNVLEHGCGGLNIDASRIDTSNEKPNSRDYIREKQDGSWKDQKGRFEPGKPVVWDNSKGRFPANLVLSHNSDCDDTCTDAMKFNVFLANEALCVLKETKLPNSQFDYQFCHDFYDELFQLVSAYDQDIFPSQHDVRAFVCFALYLLEYNQNHLLLDRPSSLGGFLQCCIESGKLKNTSFVRFYTGQILSGKLNMSLFLKSLKTSNNNLESKNFSDGRNEKKYCTQYTSDQLMTLCFVNTCLAYESCYTRVVCGVKALDEQSGVLSSGHAPKKSKASPFGGTNDSEREEIYYGKGGASRFFYCAKASKRDRNSGLSEGEHSSHPTVKNTKLMEYLIKLITPQNGTVFDPFMGSGSTGVAAKRLGFDFVGIEQNKEYFEIASKRICNVESETKKT